MCFHYLDYHTTTPELRITRRCSSHPSLSSSCNAIDNIYTIQLVDLFRTKDVLRYMFLSVRQPQRIDNLS